MKKKINFPLAIIFIVLCGALLAVVVLKCCYLSKPSEQPSEQTTEDETADWKTYRNEEYGFEINYPENYVVEEDLELKELKIRPEESKFYYFLGVVDINIHINTDNLSINDWVNGKFSNAFDIDINEISINGLKGIELYTGCCGGCERRIYFPNNNLIYSISLLQGSPGGSKLCQDDICIDCELCCFDISGQRELTFNQMLSSFRFIEEDETGASGEIKITGEISLLYPPVSGWAIFDGEQYYFMSGEKAEEIIDHGKGSRFEIEGLLEEKEESTSERIKKVKIIEVSSYKVLYSTYGSLGIGLYDESECEKENLETSEGVKFTLIPKSEKGFICRRPNQPSFYCKDLDSYNHYYFLYCSPYISYFNCDIFEGEDKWDSWSSNLKARNFNCSSTATKINTYKRDYRYNPELLEGQFHILEQTAKLDLLDNGFKEKIKSDFILFGGVNGIPYRIKQVDLIFNSNLNSQGLRMIVWFGSDMDIDYFYRAVFLKDNKIIDSGLTYLFEGEDLEWAEEQIGEASSESFLEKWDEFENRIIQDVESKDESSRIYQIVKDYDSMVASIKIDQ